MSVLVIAPHPDDEVLGMGGTIARLVKAGRKVTVVIVTRAMPPIFSEETVTRSRAEARDAHAALGVTQAKFLDFPAARLDEVPHYQLNAALLAEVAEIRPTSVYIPFRGDIHRDHQLVFDSALVAVRPTNGICVNEVFAYETVSETNWNAPGGISPAFIPDTFVDISDTLQTKLAALRCFESQLRPFPAERSLEAIEALAKVRGASVSLPAAEAFMLVRQVIR